MESIILSILLIIILIILSGFFAGAETAITGVSPATIHRLKSEGNKRAALVSKLRYDKERLISALLLGNSACNTFASAIAASLAITLFNNEGSIIYVTILMTIVIFIFAEVLPKSYAFENAEKFSLATAPLLTKLIKVLYPVITLVQIIVNYILIILKLNKNQQHNIISATEELRGAIELHHHTGSVVKNDRDMLGSILDLKNTTIDKIMIHRSNINSIDIELPIEEIIKQALISPHTRIPLWCGEIDNIIAVLNIKDLLKEVHLIKDLTKLDITAITSEPWFVHQHTKLNEQLHEFRQRRNHLAIVIDEYGDLLGMLTLEDILEEIVGQIEDEHDLIKQGILITLDGAFMIDGVVTIKDINRQLDWNLPTNSASTLAGFIMQETEQVPNEGESFNLYDIIFTVISKDHNQIKQVKAEICDHPKL